MSKATSVKDENRTSSSTTHTAAFEGFFMGKYLGLGRACSRHSINVGRAELFSMGGESGLSSEPSSEAHLAAVCTWL